MSDIYLYDGGSVRRIAAPTTRPLRWAAWRNDGASALIAGNRGEAFSFDGEAFAPLATGTSHNLRAVAWSPDGKRALLAGNRGAVLLYDGARFVELPPSTTENLRRVAWHPDGLYALIVGNGGVTLRFDVASGSVYPLPGDRAHTFRSIAFRADGAYALIGAYASRFGGYPRPHMLYRCDGRYVQAILSTDNEDDALAIDWQPGADPPNASVLVASYNERGRVMNTLLEYGPAGIRTTRIEGAAAILGAAFAPNGSHLLLCGERGALVAREGDTTRAIDAGASDNLVGPFWRPAGPPLAIMLTGPQDRVYTV
jgi:Tol biopolymer transport system component